MIDRVLEANLQRHFHNGLDGELAPAGLVERVAAIPAQRAIRWPLQDRLRSRRPVLLAAVMTMLALLLVGGWVVGSQLLRPEEDRLPVILPAVRACDLPAVRACDLVTAEFLSSRFNASFEARGGDGTYVWWPYSRDWYVPREAEDVLGPATSHCSFAYKPNVDQLGHLELFVRNEATTLEQAGLLVATLFDESRYEGPAASGRRDPVTPTLLPMPSSAIVEGYIAWLTADEAHDAGAILIGPYLVVISAGQDLDLDAVLDIVVREVAGNLGEP